MTLEEWSDLEDRRWLGRRAYEYGAFRGPELCATLQAPGGGALVRSELIVDPEHPDAGRTLLHALVADRASQSEAAPQLLSLVPSFAAATESALRAAGTEPGAEFVLCCRRTTSLARDAARVRARLPIPSGG